jgi:hypothetical protein
MRTRRRDYAALTQEATEMNTVDVARSNVLADLAARILMTD